LALSLLAIGVVYGDIGTSPIYAFKACFSPEYGMTPTPENVYGMVSLILWALTITVSIKYIVVIMRADNHGEGGILALLAIIRGGRSLATMPRYLKYLLGLGLMGAALLYGDGVITPAISVLSAVEGLGVASKEFASLAVPISAVILFVLFAVQRFGVARVGGVFGPVMLVWFLAIGGLGAARLIQDPAILRAVNPWYGVIFFAHHGFPAFVALGAVVLAVTGAEALYADMGYFGRGPIRVSWFGLVFPALLLNYAGQGANILSDHSAVSNPFFLLAPRAMLYPYVALATVATIIASQALISGAFTLTSQAMQLGYCPRLEVVHTAPEAEHIYIPAVNRLLMIGCILLVVGFRTSDAMGAAYGIAVTGTMGITTILFYDITRTKWGWSRRRAMAVCGVFLIVDWAFFASNSLKVMHGGWVPLVIAAAVWLLMTTWAWGRERLLALRRQDAVPLSDLFSRMDVDRTIRPPGTGIFVTSHPDGAPRVLVRQLDYSHVLPANVVLAQVEFEEIPAVTGPEHLSITSLSHGFFQMAVRFGFLQQPELYNLISDCRTQGIAFDAQDVTFYTGRENLVIGPTRNPLVRWRKGLFRVMLNNSRSAPQFLGLPANRVVELGAVVEF
jgi:KUP system potassium uptake protein